MASIHPKRGILYLSYYYKGKRYVESLGLKDSRENRKIAKEIRLDKERDLTLPLSSIKRYLTVSEAIKSFQRYNFDKADNTKSSYRVVFAYVSKFFGKDQKVSEITSEDILELQSYLSQIKSNITGDKLSQNSIASYFRHLKSFFNWLIENDFYSGKNPVPRLKSVTRPIVTIPDDHFTIVLAYLKGKNIKHYRMIKMLQLTGRRVNEILSLYWENVDFEGKIITMYNQKANRQEIIPIHKSLEDFLKTFRKKKGKIFDYQSADSLHFFRRALVRLDLPNYPLHSIRKTYATKLVHNDVAIFDAAKLLGHSNIRTTIEFYAKVDVKKLNNQLDKIFDDGN